jgi:hypothetical protein
MRKLGYTLFVVGFIWVAFFAVEADPIARSSGRRNAQKLFQKQDYTRQDISVAIGDTSDEGAFFAHLSFVGGLLMLAGGIILGKIGRQSSPPEPPMIGR